MINASEAKKLTLSSVEKIERKYKKQLIKRINSEIKNCVEQGEYSSSILVNTNVPFDYKEVCREIEKMYEKLGYIVFLKEDIIKTRLIIEWK